MGKVKSDEFVPSDADSSTEEESDEPKKKYTSKKKAQKSPEKRERVSQLYVILLPKRDLVS